MKPPSFSSSSFHRRSSSTFYLITLSFIIFVAILYGEDYTCILKQPFLKQQHPEELEQHKLEKDAITIAPFGVGRTEKGCDVFDGRWVYDEVTRPQYEESECPYIPADQTCQAHGRPEKGYQHWRWQPHGCSLPSFNATFMLEMLRGKRMMFAGDSLNRGQFSSMVCLLHRAIPEGAKSIETNDSLIIFRATEYNATIGFHWAPFLVESNADNPIIHRVTDRIVRVGSINKHARHWKGADIIVFNTYLWWMTKLNLRIVRGSLKGGMKDLKKMEKEDAYRMVMKRVARWVEKNIDPHKTRVFFTTMSPLHERGEEWGGAPEERCYNQTMPIMNSTYWGIGSSKTLMQVTGEVLSKTKVPITLLNITQLSEYRKDAHTSIYKKFWYKLTPEQLANPKGNADCVHWCLPGLPDTWNELLYTKLFFP